MNFLGKLRDRWDANRDVLTEAEQPSPFYFTVASGTDTGRARTGNEDSILVVSLKKAKSGKVKSLLAVLADGMGGSNAGEFASALACKTIERHFLAHAGARDTGQTLMEAVRQANRSIFTEARKNPERRGMGTTCVALAMRGANAWMAYVGDSRLYLARGGVLYRMSEDHTVVFEMVKEGLLSAEAARNHPDRNVLSRALGTKEQVEVSRWESSFLLNAGDRLLLCSDGLHDLVGDDQVLETIKQSKPEDAVARLLTEANARGGYDNISAIVVEVESEQDVPAPALKEGAPLTSVPITRKIILE